jgi:hypothetical protein
MVETSFPGRQFVALFVGQVPALKRVVPILYGHRSH